jgi:NADH:flavin oxidoreductase / NADH oxidase family/Histidine kinase-, DNA gyrase B-, and HSP90-like ATPase
MSDKAAGQIGRVQLKNRLSVAPMTRVSAMADGTPTARMVEYYQAFAAGGFGLIVTEGTYPDDRFSQGYFNQPGIVTRSHVDGWRRITDAVHEADGVIFLQIMHAGALSQCNRATIAPSAVKPLGTKMPEYGGTGEFPIPNAMSKLDLQQTVESFANAASRAEVARFDGIEIHGANGYLLDQEAVHNAVRHANPTLVTITLRWKTPNIVLEVRDNGVGISTDKLAKSEGFGLGNRRERARKLDGRIEIKTAPGQGTGIIVTVPPPHRKRQRTQRWERAVPTGRTRI